MGDPIAKILTKSGNLTKTQLETLLIDILAEKITDSRLVYEEKAKLRLLKSGVSRGSFNRTLRQGRKNVIKAVYTVILLGYLGILESPQMEPYIELANRLHTYARSYRMMLKEGKAKEENTRMIRTLQRELQEVLSRLVEPSSMSRTT